MKKRWPEISSDAQHEVTKFRQYFLDEHRNADQIVCDSNGVPLQAVYFSPEMPGYGKTRSDVPMLWSPKKTVRKANDES